MTISHRARTASPAARAGAARPRPGPAPGKTPVRRIAGPPPASVLIAFLSAPLFPAPALAYIGPGVGLGAVAVAVALVLGLFLLVAGLVWFPLKRMVRRRRHGPDTPDTPDRPTDPE